jgi:hypothetical protein
MTTAGTANMPRSKSSCGTAEKQRSDPIRSIIQEVNCESQKKTRIFAVPAASLWLKRIFKDQCE